MSMQVKASETCDHAATLAELSLHQVVVPHPDEVTGYVQCYPQMGNGLPSLCATVRQELGADVELSLELYQDPEIDDRYLSLYVREREYRPDLMARIEAVRERVNPKLDDVPGDFLVTTDFRRPRGQNGIQLERIP